MVLVAVLSSVTWKTSHNYSSKKEYFIRKTIKFLSVTTSYRTHKRITMLS